jgi:predicted small secreted protein
MKRVINLMALSAMLLGSLTLVGCQTMHGLGEDISSGGNALAKAAEPSKKKKSSKQQGSSSADKTSSASSSQ